MSVWAERPHVMRYGDDIDFSIHGSLEAGFIGPSAISFGMGLS